MINIYGKERAVALAEYVIETKDTVRGAARRFGVSKSTVHKDLTHKLRRINPRLYETVKEILATNKSERHLRGGEATRKKYLMQRIGRYNSEKGE